MQKQKELTFYNISRHFVKSNCGSGFQGAGFFCTYPISFLLKQSCDNNIVNCIQMILYRGAVLFEPHFKAYTRIKSKTLYEELIFLYVFLVLRSHNYPTYSFINVDAKSCICSF